MSETAEAAVDVNEDEDEDEAGCHSGHLGAQNEEM